MKNLLTKSLAVIITLVMVMSIMPIYEFNTFAGNKSTIQNPNMSATNKANIQNPNKDTVNNSTIQNPNKRAVNNSPIDNPNKPATSDSPMVIPHKPDTSDRPVLPATKVASQALLSTVDHIAITKLPDKTSYILGADYWIVYMGLEMTVYYTDNTSAVYRFNDLQDYYFNGEYVNAYFIDPAAGIVQVDYLGKSATFNVTVVANPVDHIEVTHFPYMTAYTDGVDYNIDYFGFEMTVYYTNGTTAVYRYNDLQTSNFNGYSVYLYFSDYANGIVTVDYMGKSATFSVSVIPNPVDYIEVTKLPDKTQYITGVDTGINFTGFEMTVHYTNSTTAVYRYNDNGSYFNRYFVNGYFIDTVGTAQVDYMGKSAIFNVTMIANPVSSIEVTKLPVKTAYINGVETYVDRVGMEMTVHYTDNTSAVYNFNYDGYMFNTYYVGVEFTDYAAGTVTVTYMNRTAVFGVTIIPNPVDHIAVTKLPDKMVYVSDINNYVDYAGMEVTVYYTDSTSAVYKYNNDGYSFNGNYVTAYFPDMLIGKIQVDYMGKTTSFNVTFTVNTVDHIEVTKLPVKTSYIFSVEGTADCAGMEMTIFYTNGTSAVYVYDANAYFNGCYVNTVLYYSFSNAKDGAVQVEYMGKYTSFHVDIIQNPVLRMEVTKLPDKTSYMNGAETSINYTGLELTIYYTDSTSAVYRFNNDGYNFNGYPVSVYFTNYQTGQVLVDYLGKTATFNVTIVANPVDRIVITNSGNVINNDLLYTGDLTGLTITVYKTDNTDFSVSVPVGYTADYTYNNINETYKEISIANSDGTFLMYATINYKVVNSVRTGVSSVVIKYMGKTATIIPLTAPTLVASLTTPTNFNVTVTAAYPVTAAITEYKIGSGAWTSYTRSVNVIANDTVYARYTDASGNKSNIGSIVIGNIEKIIAFNGSTTVINESKHFIYGLVPGITKTAFESSYIRIIGDARLSYTPASTVLGTGTKVELIDNVTNVIMSTYYIVIFGDVNDDGNIDSIDAGMAVDIENNLIVCDPIIDCARYMAGDVNADGNIDSVDAGIIVDYENAFLAINQTTGLVAVR